VPSIPSEEEVDAGNYKYDPCPIDGLPIHHITFFHHFYAPASKHPDSMWAARLPWKLGPGLGPMAQGWGIQLEEHANWPLFAAFMCFLLLLSGIVAVIYCWRTGDHSTGVAIGAWLTAVQTMGITAVFFWWW
jgi:hypothetical protein